jgi:hypothetical protein
MVFFGLIFLLVLIAASGPLLVLVGLIMNSSGRNPYRPSEKKEKRGVKLIIAGGLITITCVILLFALCSS